MAKEKTGGEEIKASMETFTPAQMSAIQDMLKGLNNKSERSSISMYKDVRDPKKIETVKVSRFDGKFVFGFKDLNSDPYRTEPKYSESKMDIARKLPDQPFVTLILDDGTEKEVSLIDYMNNRKQVECKVKEVLSKEIIDDKGILGRQGTGGYAAAIEDNGTVSKPVTIRAEVKRVERTYLVEVPGFEKPVEFIEAFLA